MSGMGGGTPDLYTQPWQGTPAKLPEAAGEKAFPDSGNNQNTGASRQIGEFGGYPVGQVDVRTPFMQLLEQQSAPLLGALLTNPQAIAQQFSQLAGPVPGAPNSSLASFLFGGAPTGGGYQPAMGGGGAAGGGGAPSGPPAGGGPLAGQQPGQPINLPASGGAVDEKGQPIPGVPTGQQAANMPLYQALQGFAQQLGGGAQANWGAPIQAGGLDQMFRALNEAGVFAGNDAFVGGSPTQGTGASVIGKLLSYDPTLRNLGYNYDQNRTLDTAGQLWGLLDPYSRQHVVGNVASTAAGGGSNPTLDAFLKNIGFSFHAGGGPLDPNAINIVGENGPEAIVGNQVIPNLAGNAAANSGQFPASPMQGPGTGSIQQLLQQNPEMDAFNATKNILGGQNGILGSGGGGQQVMQALQPLFQQNLQFGLNQLRDSVPSVYNSGAAIAGTDLAARALNDYNLLSAQAMQQGQQNTLGGLGVLGQLAGQAGNGAFNRNLQAGQLATQRDLGYGNLNLAAQQQQYNQTVNPTLQLMLAALGMATPTAYQTVVPGKK